MEGNPINRGPASRQKAPVRERCDSPAPTPTGPLWPPESSTVAAHPDTTPSRERRRVLYIPHMEGSIMHPNQAIDIGARQRVHVARSSCVTSDALLIRQDREFRDSFNKSFFDL